MLFRRARRNIGPKLFSSRSPRNRRRQLRLGRFDTLEQRCLLAANFSVLPSVDADSIQPGQEFDYHVNVQTGGEGTTGLSLRVHFDSSQLELTEGDIASSVPGLSATQLQDTDSSIYDTDPATDRVANILWVDIGGNWLSGVTNSTQVITLRFTATENFSATAINITGDLGRANHPQVETASTQLSMEAIGFTSQPLNPSRELQRPEADIANDPPIRVPPRKRATPRQPPAQRTPTPAQRTPTPAQRTATPAHPPVTDIPPVSQVVDLSRGLAAIELSGGRVVVLDENGNELTLGSSSPVTTFSYDNSVVMRYSEGSAAEASYGAVRSEPPTFFFYADEPAGPSEELPPASVELGALSGDSENEPSEELMLTPRVRKSENGLSWFADTVSHQQFTVAATTNLAGPSEASLNEPGSTVGALPGPLVILRDREPACTNTAIVDQIMTNLPTNLAGLDSIL